MTEHTPGAWDVRIGEEACFHPGNRVSIVHYDTGPDSDRDEDGNPFEYTVAEVWRTSGDGDIADGYLIAAAPAMLQELERLAESFGWEPSHPAMRAIAQARGIGQNVDVKA